MATYTLSGSGTQTINANVGALHIHFTSVPTNASSGHANPSNYYGLALVRAGDGTGYFPAVALDSTDQWLALPTGTTQIGYSIFGGVTATFTEVFGTSPLDGPTPSVESLSDVNVSSPTNNQLLAWISSASKWENVDASTVVPAVSLTHVNATLGADVSIPSTNTYVDILSVSLVAGTWVITCQAGTNNNVGAAYQMKVWNGTTVYGSANQYNPQGYAYITTTVVVTLASTTTVKFSMAATSVSACKVPAATPFNSSGNNAVQINAIKIG